MNTGTGAETDAERFTVEDSGPEGGWVTMDRNEAMEILKREGLEKYAHFGEPDSGAADKVCLLQRGNRWVTMISA